MIKHFSSNDLDNKFHFFPIFPDFFHNFSEYFYNKIRSKIPL